MIVIVAAVVVAVVAILILPAHCMLCARGSRREPHPLRI